MVKLFKLLLYAVLVCAGLFSLFLVFMTINDYKPEPEEKVYSSSTPSVLKVGDTLSFMSWNIGYAGLDAGMDFFYDGGTQVFPTQKQSFENLDKMSDYVANHRVDFLLVQEIDRKARRSYNVNQVDTFAKAAQCEPLFATNYDVKWVPLPVLEPMGNVESGIAMFSKKIPSSVHRHSFPVNFSWPLKVFMLDRCFMVSRYPTSNGKDLLVIVTHNSAFDDGGELRKAELDYFRNYLLAEYKKGNYVVAGGDFNQCPAHFRPSDDDLLFDREDDFHTIPDTLLSADWNFVFDPSAPTNRRVIAPYNPQTTKTTLIDFYIASPNVTVLNVRTDNLNFANSDHNPVFANFVLRP